MKNHYSLLGLENSATPLEIKKNYRLLAAKYHPDKNKDPEAAAKFILITEAYDVLSNKKSRIKYDLFRWEQLQRKEDSYAYIDVVKPPPESTRTRRNKAQQKRTVNYHQESSLFKKQMRLLAEYFFISGRYILHIIGITLLLVIGYSMTQQVSESFEKGVILGIVICAFIAVVFYVILWILKIIACNIYLDIEALSVFFKVPLKKAQFRFGTVFTFLLIVYFVVLSAVF